MKTINQIADEKANTYGYSSIDGAVHAAKPSTIYSIMAMVADEYARQCCDEQKMKCVENVETYVSPNGDVCIDFSSILNTPNVVK